MKKIIITICVIITLASPVRAADSSKYEITMKQDILCLMMAYPEYIKDVTKENDGSVYIIMNSGKKVLYDDKKNKSFDEKLFNTDIQDMLEQPYPLTSINKVMDKNVDPGRLRVYPILNEVYGQSKSKVEANLKMANLGYRRFQFNGNNNAAKSLENAVNELLPIARSNRKVSSCLFPSSGTFNYRNISGTNLKSPHSFGIAIDLARDRKDYWKWVSKNEGDSRINFYPKEIVETFEKNNFVWGGKWNHFDILHFEYRPEIILKARYFGNKNNNEKKWYAGAPSEDKNVKEYIEKINRM